MEKERKRNEKAKKERGGAEVQLLSDRMIRILDPRGWTTLLVMTDEGEREKRSEEKKRRRLRGLTRYGVVFSSQKGHVNLVTKRSILFFVIFSLVQRQILDSSQNASHEKTSGLSAGQILYLSNRKETPQCNGTRAIYAT